MPSAGAVPSSQLLAFSVGMKLVIVSTNLVAGFTAIAITLRTLRFRRAMGTTEDSGPSPGTT